MKRLFGLVALMLALGILYACTSGSDGASNGIVHRETGDCYIFMLPAGKTVHSYFQLERPVHTIAGTDVDGSSLGAVEYCAESRGGYVAYKGNLVAYVPAGGNENDVRSLCGSLLRNSGNYMTFAEVCKYLPWLTK